MKKTLLTIAVIAALIGTPAVAADMAVKAPPLPPVAAYSWTGFYGGLNAGGGWGGATNSYNFVTPAGFVTPIANDSSHPSGFIGGGQLGYKLAD
jgi:outer membrane immunogenic protein